MRTKFFRLILPMAVLAIGVLSAFGTKESAGNGSALVPNESGWYHLSADELCKESTMCNIQNGPVCTINSVTGAQQLYRRTAPKVCEFTLYKPIP